LRQNGHIKASLGQLLRRNVGDIQTIDLTTLKVTGKIYPHHEIAWGMTSSAMTQTLDQIGPPCPQLRAIFLNRRLSIWEIQQGPEIHERPHRQTKYPCIVLVGHIHGLDAH